MMPQIGGDVDIGRKYLGIAEQRITGPATDCDRRDGRIVFAGHPDAARRRGQERAQLACQPAEAQRGREHTYATKATAGASASASASASATLCCGNEGALIAQTEGACENGGGSSGNDVSVGMGGDEGAIGPDELRKKGALGAILGNRGDPAHEQRVVNQQQIRSDIDRLRNGGRNRIHREVNAVHDCRGSARQQTWGVPVGGIRQRPKSLDNTIDLEDCYRHGCQSTDAVVRIRGRVTARETIAEPALLWQ